MDIQNSSNNSGKIAILFPGQGSQTLGMLSALASEHSAVFETIYGEASKVLGYDLWELTQEGPAEKLNRTEYTQPALLAAGFACYRVWEAQEGPRPSLMLGHSLGEYTALVAAGYMAFREAIALVAARGRAMQAAVPSAVGAMAAILGGDDAQVLEACKQAAAETNQVVMPANWNSPGQVVISGMKIAVEKSIEILKAQGVKRCIELPVSVPSHSSLMKNAAYNSEFAEALAKITLTEPDSSNLICRVVHNVDASIKQSSAEVKVALQHQLYSAVQWVQCIEKAYQKQGIRTFLELGPGQVLSGLNKRILEAKQDKTVNIQSLNQPEHFKDYVIKNKEPLDV
ncbi:MAG: ACP S-malonyltransferase [Gammaproteobacteria bacterium]